MLLTGSITQRDVCICRSLVAFHGFGKLAKPLVFIEDVPKLVAIVGAFKPLPLYPRAGFVLLEFVLGHCKALVEKCQRQRLR